jgi:medium-chain acyl-[acyl-carrier-protein] hydrolase
MVHNLTNTFPNNWFVVPRLMHAARLRLFCFHHAGGQAEFFNNWADFLYPDIEVLALQLPGRSYRVKEKLFTSFDSLLPVVTKKITPFLKTDKPFAFFGHSLGSLVAFELARRLRHRNLVWLVVSAMKAPQIRSYLPKLSELPDMDLVEVIRTLAGTPDSVLDNKNLMQAMLPSIKADFQVSESYQYIPGEPLDIPISAFGGDEDATVNFTELDAWRKQTNQTFSLSRFAGHHFYLEKIEIQLLEKIREKLLK